MKSIPSRLLRAAEYVRSFGYSPAYISLHGSQNYGLALDCEEYRSDYDFKCVVFPSLRSLCEGKRPASLTIDFEDGQIDIKDIRLFTENVCKMNPAYLESLQTQHYLVCGGAIEEMRKLVPMLFSERGAEFAKVCARSFEEKARRMCHDSPAQREKIGKFGYDGKQVHHMYRLLLILRSLENREKMVLLAPQEERKFLLDLKMNRISLVDVLGMIDKWREELFELEKRIAQKQNQSKDEAVKRMKSLCIQALYDHCRREVLKDGRLQI